MKEEEIEVDGRKGKQTLMPCGCRHVKFEDNAPAMVAPCLPHALANAGSMLQQVGAALQAGSGGVANLQARVHHLERLVGTLCQAVGVDVATGLLIGRVAPGPRGIVT